MKTIWAHSLVKNEERYIWYAIKSVIDHVDRILVWDTGSTDSTVKIVKSLKKEYPKKINLKLLGDVTPKEYTDLRQKMLEETKSDWFMILDGDEVWWEDSIKKIVRTIQEEGDSLDSIVNPYINLVGDIYHKIPESHGKYQIDGKVGHISIRFINKSIPGLYTTKPHGQHGYFDENDLLVQERDPKKRKYIDASYLHFTHLTRSSSREFDRKVPKRAKKLKYELGTALPLDYFFPEVFFIDKPVIISSPWKTRSLKYMLSSKLLFPLKAVKTKCLPAKSGY